MPVTKDAAYWTARRAKEKQRLADSGRRKRPRGAAPANMRWDDVRGWVNKDDPHQPAEAAVASAELYSARSNATIALHAQVHYGLVSP